MDSFIEALLSEKTDKIPDEYTCDHSMKRLTFTKQDDKLVGEVLSEENAYCAV